MQSNATSWRHFDFWLFGATLVLVIFGVTMIRSAVAGNIELTTETNLVNRQITFAVISFIAMFITASIDYHYWSSVSRMMYLATIIALLVLNIIAPVVFGSTRWFQVLTINIQPSEVAKIGIMVWILLQPNLSTSIVILVLWFALLWAGGLKVKHLLMFIGIGIAAAAILIPLLIQLDIIKEYQIGRVTSFLFPDPNARYGDIYNIQQALISIGSGGWFGQGYGGGSQVQLRFLKVRWSDYIFSAMAQEFGFVGTLLVLAILAFVIYRCLRAARLSRDTFGALIAYGVATLISFQALVNIGVNLKLLPATGLTLPFISYGGSSLLSALLGIGLVESVLIRQKALEF